MMFFFFSSRRRHTRCGRDWSSDVCSSDLGPVVPVPPRSLRASGEGAGGDERPGLLPRRDRVRPVPDTSSRGIPAVAVMTGRLTFLLGVLGGVLAGAGLVVYLIAPERTWVIAGAEGLAAACLTIFLVTHFELFRAFSGRRATRLGFNSLVMVALFFLILRSAPRPTLFPYTTRFPALEAYLTRELVIE